MATYTIILVPIDQLQDTLKENSMFVSAHRHALVATGNGVLKLKCVFSDDVITAHSH